MNYKLVIQFPIADASADEFDRLILIESELGLVLRNSHQVKGHDIGAEEINILIHTDNPSEAFELAKSVLSKKDLNTISVAFKDMQGDKYTLIWPQNSTREFRFDLI